MHVDCPASKSSGRQTLTYKMYLSRPSHHCTSTLHYTHTTRMILVLEKSIARLGLRLYWYEAKNKKELTSTYSFAEIRPSMSKRAATAQRGMIICSSWHCCLLSSHMASSHLYCRSHPLWRGSYPGHAVFCHRSIEPTSCLELNKKEKQPQGVDWGLPPRLTCLFPHLHDKLSHFFLSLYLALLFVVQRNLRSHSAGLKEWR